MAIFASFRKDSSVLTAARTAGSAAVCKAVLYSKAVFLSDNVLASRFLNTAEWRLRRGLRTAVLRVGRHVCLVTGVPEHSRSETESFTESDLLFV